MVLLSIFLAYMKGISIFLLFVDPGGLFEG